jgi:aldehyde dehydrogenase (NAD+)
MSIARTVGKHFVAGTWLPTDGDTFPSRSPANRNEVVGVFPAGSPGVAHDAVAAARAAYPGWRRTSRIHRAECFDRLARIIDRETDNLARLMARECGKTLGECRAEVVEGLHMVQYVFGTGRMPVGTIVASEIEEKDAFVRRKSKGVVAVITPWNFPFAVPLWMLGPSLVEGNTAVYKPSEDTPAVGQRLVELFVEAGFPAGTINLVHGDGSVGEALVRNPEVSVVLFTGSYAVGHRIQQLSADFPDRIVAAEMGSKSAVIVCEDCRMDLAVNAGILSAFKTSGQRCVSAGRILVSERVFDDYARRFAAVAKQLRVGDPLDPDSFTGPVINESAVEKVVQYNKLAKEEGASVLVNGDRLSDRGHADGYYVSPFVYRMEHGPKVRTIREEVFGPHVALIPFKTNEDAVRIYNDTEYGLSMAVITENYRTMRLFREECEFGMGYVNLPCIGVEAVTHKVAWTVNHGTEIKMAQGLSADVEGH